ncbi:hypothetical protein ACWEFL_04785 [Streptomyces sp. NPDC004838]
MADDEEFYRRDRPDDAKLPEDRPRGGTEWQRPRQLPLLLVILLILAIIVVIAFGIMLFP